MEKYGTMPPRFSKDWWEHYWTYYKFHFLAIILIIFVIVELVHGCVTRVHYDIQIEYAAYSQMPQDESITKLNDFLTSSSSDVTGNGKVEAHIGCSIAADPKSSAAAMQYENAVITKFMTQLQTSENQIYIVDKKFADKLIDFESLLPVSEWATDIDDDAILENSLISLSGNSTLSEMGFDTDYLYIGVLSLKDYEKNDEEAMSKFENAKHIANELIKE